MPRIHMHASVESDGNEPRRAHALIGHRHLRQRRLDHEARRRFDVLLSAGDLDAQEVSDLLRDSLGHPRPDALVDPAERSG